MFLVVNVVVVVTVVVTVVVIVKVNRLITPVGWQRLLAHTTRLNGILHNWTIEVD